MGVCGAGSGRYRKNGSSALALSMMESAFFVKVGSASSCRKPGAVGPGRQNCLPVFSVT